MQSSRAVQRRNSTRKDVNKKLSMEFEVRLVLFNLTFHETYVFLNVLPPLIQNIFIYSARNVKLCNHPTGVNQTFLVEIVSYFDMNLHVGYYV